MEDDHRQPEVEVPPELVPLDVALEIAVGGRQDADVDPAIPDPADPPHGPVLHRLEQLALERQLHVAHLVEEEEAAFGRLEQAHPRFLGVGERAALVAEQLRLHQGRRQAPCS